MNNTNIEKLTTSKTTSFFLEYKPTIDIQYAKSLVGKLIYFTWTYFENGTDKTREELSGKVLDFYDNKLKIYTHYVTILEEDLNNKSDLNDNPLIQDIHINDITNVAEFSNYKFEGWETLPDDYYGNIYKITNMEDVTITAIPYDFDGINVYLMIRESNKTGEEIVRRKYPISLIKEFLEQ